MDDVGGVVRQQPGAPLAVADGRGGGGGGRAAQSGSSRGIRVYGPSGSRAEVSALVITASGRTSSKRNAMRSAGYPGSTGR
ncbi:hypothetical protein LUX34_03505 [Streptomyces werraensis]|nr:hypothetical protein [Streptomyces werraensis]